jgi:CRP-like cAMP-binding protein
MVRKLEEHSSLQIAERNALLNLPHEILCGKRGEMLVRAGDTVKHCMVVVGGFAFRTGHIKGNRQILSTQMVGDVVDIESHIFAKSSFNVEAASATQVAMISHGSIKMLIDRYPNISAAFLTDVMVDAVQFRQTIARVGSGNAYRRIANLIIGVVRRQTIAMCNDGPTYHWPFYQEDIGAATGMTHIHVSRVLKTMKKEQAFTIDRRSITIVDWERMHSWAALE